MFTLHDSRQTGMHALATLDDPAAAWALAERLGLGEHAMVLPAQSPGTAFGWQYDATADSELAARRHVGQLALAAVG